MGPAVSFVNFVDQFGVLVRDVSETRSFSNCHLGLVEEVQEVLPLQVSDEPVHSFRTRGSLLGFVLKLLRRHSFGHI